MRKKQSISQHYLLAHLPLPIYFHFAYPFTFSCLPWLPFPFQLPECWLYLSVYLFPQHFLFFHPLLALTLSRACMFGIIRNLQYMKNTVRKYKIRILRIPTVDNRYRHLIHEVDDRLVAQFNTAKLPEKFFTPPCSTLLKLSKVQ